MPFLLALLLGLITAAGAAATFVGYRGRLTDTHPLCRRCRFDLVGRPADSTRCPECGSDLTLPRSTLTGHRQRRLALLLAGLGLTLLPLAITTTLLITSARGVNWNQYKPVWLLLYEKDAPASFELLGRLRGRKLTPAQARSVISFSLAHQADTSKKWNPVWGLFISEARAAGHVTPDQWQRYLGQAVQLTLHARPRVSRDNNLPLELWIVGRLYDLGSPVHVSLRTLSISLDNVPIHLHPGERISTAFVLARDRRLIGDRQLTLAPDRLSGFADGRHTLRLDVEWRIQASVLDGNIFTTPAEITRRATLTHTVTLLRQGADTIQLVTDDRLRPTMDHCFSLDFLTPEGGTPVRSISLNPHGRVHFDLTAGSPPVDCAFVVLLRDPTGREFPIRQEPNVSDDGLSFPANARTSESLYGDLDPSASRANRLDLILRPSPNHALHTTHMTRIWGHDIILKNLPVLRETAPAP